MATRWTTVEFPALASFAETGAVAAAATRDRPAIDATATLRNQLGISKLLLTETLQSEAAPALSWLPTAAPTTPCSGLFCSLSPSICTLRKSDLGRCSIRRG